MSFEKRCYGLLVKWLNTLPSQGNIHGFEFHTGHHIFEFKLEINFSSFYYLDITITNVYNNLPKGGIYVNGNIKNSNNTK